MTTPATLWRDAVGSDPSRPFVTSYDEAGGRVELSFATIDNWIAKTANFLVEEFAVDSGERVGLAAPLHWQSLAWLYSCWAAGATPVLPGAARWAEAAVVAAGPRQLPTVLSERAHDVLALSLHPMGAPLADRPEGVADYTTEVRGFGDRFSPSGPPEQSLPGLESAGRGDGSDQGRLAEQARGQAERWGLSDRERVLILTDSSLESPVDAATARNLLACTAARAAVLLVPDTVTHAIPSLARKEHVTAVLPSPNGSAPSDVDVTVLS